MHSDLLKALGYIETTYFTPYVRNMFRATILYRYHGMIIHFMFLVNVGHVVGIVVSTRLSILKMVLISSKKTYFFLYACASCYELPYNLSTMGLQRIFLHSSRDNWNVLLSYPYVLRIQSIEFHDSSQSRYIPISDNNKNVVLNVMIFFLFFSNSCL